MEEPGSESVFIRVNLYPMFIAKETTMNELKSFYLCPTCFATQETGAAHPHPMIHVDTAAMSVELCRPPIDAQGRLQSRAPRWFLHRVRPAMQ
jgi:hypothetical protein